VELTWLQRLRIAVVVSVGAIFIGVLAWPLAAPSDPVSSVYLENISLLGALILFILAFFLGFISYFISWPYGKEIGILAVPSGLAVWSFRTEGVAKLMQMNPTAAKRLDILSLFTKETFFWLFIIFLGFAGVLLAWRVWPSSRSQTEHKNSNLKFKNGLNIIISLVISVLIVQFFISVFAKDVAMLDNAVIAQPAIGQIAFAVTASFGLAAFVVKKFFNTNYIWPILSCIFVTSLPLKSYTSQNDLQTFIQNWPATFFPSSLFSILPVQMVAFGTFGSVIGYWLAIRYNYWRKHEI
jgi:hypothetical protein